MNSIDPSILFAMLKGEPGTRKSTHAVTFPKPQYWFSWDRKMASLMVPMQKWGIDPKLISYDDYENWSKPADKLRSFQIECPFKTLVFDSITSMTDMTLRQTITMKAGGSRRSGATAGKQIAGISVNELEDYNAESAALSELIALCKDIHTFHKVNIVLIAHVIQAEYRNTTNPALTHISRQIVTASKKAAAKIPAYCGEVYHFNIKRGFTEDATGEYTCLTEHTGDDFARTALDLPKEIKFNDRPLYDTWVAPAIAALKKKENDDPSSAPIRNFGG